MTKALAKVPSRPLDVHEERLVRVFSRMHRSGGMVMIDQSMAYNMDEGADPARAAGVLIKDAHHPKDTDDHRREGARTFHAEGMRRDTPISTSSGFPHA